MSQGTHKTFVYKVKIANFVRGTLKIFAKKNINLHSERLRESFSRKMKIVKRNNVFVYLKKKFSDVKYLNRYCWLPFQRCVSQVEKYNKYHNNLHRAEHCATINASKRYTNSKDYKTGCLSYHKIELGKLDTWAGTEVCRK